MAEPLRGILVGLGGRGRYWLGNGLRHPDVVWVAAVEPDARNRERGVAAGAPADRLFDTLAEAVASVGREADFVMDVTPPAVHESIARQTFEAGLHLIGEKPMSDDFAAARRMVEMGKQAGKIHMITQNYRFGPQPRTARRVIAEGLIGPVGLVDIAFFMNWADNPGSHYVLHPYMFTKDMGIHHFDMLRYVLADEPEAAQCATWNPPWGWHKGDASHVAIFTFHGGAMAVHRGLGCAVGTRTGWNGEWRIEGPEGTITWEGAEIYHTHLHRVERPVREQIFPDRSPAPPNQDPLLTEFVAAIREGRAPECNAADNLHSLAMVEASVRSAERGGARITLAEVLEGE
ncbi:MAG: Gfo/Idh/MocA family oxidoreductase [Chloroflexi bacterium]|nr:Gfo/Idh/MocA family oxidoreductase [Chloroflexota bacterium]